MNMKFVALGAVAAVTISACDTGLTVIDTPQGRIECNLYTAEQVWWDHAVTFPDTMTEVQADRYCVDAGTQNLKRIRGYQ